MKPLLNSAALSLAMAALAFSTQSARAETAANQQGEIGEILVTAQKRSESVKEVPSAVAVVTAETLVDSGATELRDLNSLVPGLQITGATGSGEIVIRGITAGADVGTVAAVLFDGVVVGPEDETADHYVPEFDPAMISRVEVLKGPQGTLYGGSTLGGLVQYVSRKPTLSEPYADASAEWSDTRNGGGNYVFRGDVSAPIYQDKLGFSLSGNTDYLSGFIDDPLRGNQAYNRHRNYGIRGAVLWQVTDDLDVQVADYYSHQKSYTDEVLLSAGTPASALSYSSAVLPQSNSEYNLATVNANYNLHWATLSYIGSYQTSSDGIAIDYSKTPTEAIYQYVLPLFGGVAVPAGTNIGVPETSVYTKYTSELKLVSPDEGRFRWIAGFYYTHETSTTNEWIAGIDPATQNRSPGGVGDIQYFGLNTVFDQYAGYGNLTYYILPDLDITGGIRVSRYDQSYNQLASGADLAAYNALSAFYGLGTIPANTGENNTSRTVETYLADMRYHISDHDLVYFRFATGFRPGGPNDTVPGVPPSYGPDTTDNFEIGLKSNFWDNKGYVELAAYKIDWNDIQVEAISNGLGYLTNGGVAEIKGVEAAVSVRPLQGLNLRGTFAYTDGSLTKPATGGTGNVGDTMPNTPKYSATLSGDYDWPVANDWDAFAGASVRYVGNRNSAFQHSTTITNIDLPSYVIADLRAGVRNGPYEVTAFVRNVADKRAELGGEVYGANYIVLSRPRTIGLSVAAHW